MRRRRQTGGRRRSLRSLRSRRKRHAYYVLGSANHLIKVYRAKHCVLLWSSDSNRKDGL
jgi:hypothetical protein